MDYPLRFPDQLRPHLRALRMRCGLTQAQLGERVGVKQARIAEIEANPGAVSLDQLSRLLAALGATLHLHTLGAKPLATADAAGGRGEKPKPSSSVPGPGRSPAKAPTAARKPRAAPADGGDVIIGSKGVW